MDKHSDEITQQDGWAAKYSGKFRNIKAELQRVGVTQTQVADHLGMTYNNFNAKMNGRVPFSVPEILEMQGEFMPEASLDYLLKYFPEEEPTE